MDSVQDEIIALRKELLENNAQEVLAERIQRLKALLTDYVCIDSDDNAIPELVVTAFIKQIVVFEDHFEWYLRTDGSNQPIVCNVDGRKNANKIFSLSNAVYPYCCPQDRLHLRTNFSSIYIVSAQGNLA